LDLADGTASTARYIAFEGGEGCGKSTQAARLATGLGAELTREPGGTPLGERLRSVLLDPAGEPLSPRAEALLMAADRAQLATEVLEPALTAGRHVVTDRSAWSSLASQGYGRGLDLVDLRRMSDWALAGRWPDLVVLLDVPRDVASRRLGVVLDRFEAEAGSFHERVIDGFRALAADHADRWVVVDGSGDEAAVAAAVVTAVGERLGLAVAP
jgi:dTMP kinase